MTREEHEIVGGLRAVAIVLRAQGEIVMAEAAERAEAYIRNLGAKA